MKRIVGMVVMLSILLSACVFVGCAEEEKYYMSEDVYYNDIKFNVGKIKEEKITTGEYKGKYCLILEMSVENLGVKDYYIDFDDFYVKREMDGSQYGAIPSSLEYLFGDKIMAKDKKTYRIDFYSPFSIKEEVFVLCICSGYNDEKVIEKEIILHSKESVEKNKKYIL